MYRAKTHDIEVIVTPEYQIEQSHPDQDLYFYSYQVCITNYSTRRVKLLSRHWIIRDGNKQERHVQGNGVIGLQPNIDPGYAFEYASACPLNGPYGNMRGFYTLVDDQNQSFRIKIPLFFLRPSKPTITQHLAIAPSQPQAPIH